MDIYVDASTSWGTGIIIGQCWAAFRLAPDWKRPGQDICWLEAIALELLVYFLVQLDISRNSFVDPFRQQGCHWCTGKGP
jgi:hypothetical protein